MVRNIKFLFILSILTITASATSAQTIIDEDTYRVEGFQEEVAQHLVQIEEIRLNNNKIIEMDVGAQWEPNSDEMGSSATFSPKGEITINDEIVGDTTKISARSSFPAVTTIELEQAVPGDEIKIKFPEDSPEPVISRAEIEVDINIENMFQELEINNADLLENYAGIATEWDSDESGTISRNEALNAVNSYMNGQTGLTKESLRGISTIMMRDIDYRENWQNEEEIDIKLETGGDNTTKKGDTKAIYIKNPEKIGTITNEEWSVNGYGQINPVEDSKATATYKATDTSNENTATIHYQATNQENKQITATTQIGIKEIKEEISISPKNANVGDNLDFSVSGPEDYTYIWDFNSDEDYEKTGMSVSKSFTSTGDKTAHLKILSDGDTIGETSRSFDVSNQDISSKLDLSKDEVITNERVKIEYEVNQRVLKNGFNLVVENPSGDLEFSREVNSRKGTTYFTPSGKNGVYEAKLVADQGFLNQLFETIFGPEASERFQVVDASENLQPWMKYCEERGYNHNSAADRVNCVVDEITVDCFNEEPSSKCLEVSESVCTYYGGTGYNADNQRCMR